MEFYDPILALCNDRTKTAKKNPTIDEPQSYLNNNLLEPLGLIGLNFDFFIDWCFLHAGRRDWDGTPARSVYAAACTDQIQYLGLGQFSDCRDYFFCHVRPFRFC